MELWGVANEDLPLIQHTMGSAVPYRGTFLATCNYFVGFNKPTGNQANHRLAPCTCNLVLIILAILVVIFSIWGSRK